MQTTKIKIEEKVLGHFDVSPTPKQSRRLPFTPRMI
jgi:hypothetical protein